MKTWNCCQEMKPNEQLYACREMLSAFLLVSVQLCLFSVGTAGSNSPFSNCIF